MFAIQIKDYGDVNVLEEVEVPRPEIKPKQVLVKQHATAIDPYDVKFRLGLMGKDKKTPLITGSSAAGEIVAVGSEVERFKVGDRVAASPHLRSYADYVAIGQSKLAQIPAAVGYESAAACAMGVQTAYQLTEQVLDLKEDQKLLIHGAAGSIGFAVLQFAKHHGIKEIYATASGQGVGFLRNFDSRIKVIDYQKEDFTKNVPQFDRIVDPVGGEVLQKSLSVLKSDGKLISTVSTSDDPRAEQFFFKSNGHILEKILQQVAKNELYLEIAASAPFNLENLKYFQQAQHVVGKLVLVF
ncbi:NADP-dependent oxidoreductase [Liquorilactobacillus oeni]|uniref:Zinc-binding oxidoreductase n=1 Tax=Liquorilactobacillus oeni DSM 19972 TaxID=1423777 RepID=A0A0R1MGN8_9LACO|nr:NADP-dependent oxidoreductase [Liquorilactobacillus oeni]KRL04485.1 zinc-binding oxidoreductase [Liquorilactobacillus oeni DSM 19972]